MDLLNRHEICSATDFLWTVLLQFYANYSSLKLKNDIIIGTIPLREFAPPPVVVTQPSVDIDEINLSPVFGKTWLLVKILLGTSVLLQFRLWLCKTTMCTLFAKQIKSFALILDDLAPPSYEECCHGKVSIKDEGDSQYVCGNMSWAPMYAVYHNTEPTIPTAPVVWVEELKWERV